MGIARFFDRTVVIRRLKDIIGTDRSSLQATATADGAIQEMDREARDIIGLQDKRAWIAWFEVDLDLQEGDVITDQDTGNIYKIKEITKKDYGINEHLETILLEYNA